MWAQVSSSTPHFLHKELLGSPIKWRCLLRVLRPVRGPVTTLDCVLLKNKSLVFAPGLGCLWVLPRPRHFAKWWLSIQRFIFFSYVLLRDPPQGWLRSNKLLKRTISCEFVGDFVSSYPIMSTLEAFKSLSLPPHSILYYFRHPEKTCSCFYESYCVRETCVLVFIVVEYCFNFCLALSLEYVTGISCIIPFFLYLLNFLIHCQEYG
jgi:hypothetical protein